MNSTSPINVKAALNGLRKADFSRQCPDHGEYVPFLSEPAGALVESPCPACFQVLRKKDIRDRMNEQRIRVLEVAVKEAQVPEKYQKLGFKDFESATETVNRAVAIGKRFATDFLTHRFRGTSLIIHGPCGTGKTHLACAILREVLNNGRTGLYTTAMDLMRRIKSTWGKEGTEREQTVLNRLVEPDLLVVDEVGIQYGSESATNADLNIITEVIDKRGWGNRPNILVTNLSLEELPIWVGERVVSRMSDHGAVLVMDGPDWRKKR